MRKLLLLILLISVFFCSKNPVYPDRYYDEKNNIAFDVEMKYKIIISGEMTFNTMDENSHYYFKNNKIILPPGKGIEIIIEYEK